ncbi:serine hydrolase domain-containing protein [Paenibacillus lentus]|uniref:serine hydrolase domain-containing protein n=1 Tax=Paenibacillus lentus TaxID=1338368 RepID=UPI0013DDBAAF|nr:serine hydrolase domain-containing protein [Paenibacillus lentus]
MRKFATYLLVSSLLIWLTAYGQEQEASAQQQVSTNHQQEVDESAIDLFIETQLEKSHSPGAAVVIVRGNEVVYAKGFGWADLEQGIPVTNTTLFELGSTTKAFTGLAILQLEQQGVLSLDAPVTRYLPWLELNYEGVPVNVTIAQFLHHTSGVPFASLASIPIDASEEALERTVRGIAGSELASRPGESYEYATINYDVLGLVIQQLSGMTYEQYMLKMLQELGLNHTLPVSELNNDGRVAKGYKILMSSPHQFPAPIYRGNTPAGYLLSNVDDIGRWLMLQLGNVDVLPAYQSILDRSHDPGTLPQQDQDGNYYAAGWFVSSQGNEWSHQGSNPNYSSYIILRPDQKLGVGVLANINSAYTFHIGKGLVSMFTEEPMPDEEADFYPQLDRIAMGAVFVIGSLILGLLLGMIRLFLQLRREQRGYVPLSSRSWLKLGLVFVLFILYYWGISKLITLLFSGLPLEVVAVWAPSTVIWAIYGIYFIGLMLLVYFAVACLFPYKEHISTKSYDRVIEPDAAKEVK